MQAHCVSVVFLCECVFVCLHVCGLNVCIAGLYGMWLVGFNYLLICSHVRDIYVQRGENDISEDARRLQRQRTGNQL